MSRPASRFKSGSPNDLVAVLRQAEYCHRNRLFDTAEKHYRTLLRLAPPHFAALHGLGVLRADQGRPGDAEPLLREALGMQPDSVEARINLGIVYGRLLRFREAADQFERALVGQPAELRALRNLGVARQSLGDLRGAAECFGQLVRLAPRDTAAKEALTGLLLDLGRAAEALPLAEELVAMRPDDAASLSNLGFALHALGRRADSVQALSRAVLIGRDQPGSVYNLGCALLGLGKLAEAVTTLERARDLAPTWYEVHYNLGLGLQALGRLPEAAASHRRSIELWTGPSEERPGNESRRSLAPQAGLPEAYYNLGMVLHALNQPDQAAAAYERALALDPNNLVAHYNLGNLWAELGDFSAAEDRFGRALALDPKQASVHRSLAQVRRFTPHDRRLPGLEALAAELPLQGAGDQIETHYALAKAYADLGRHEDGFRHLLAGSGLKRQQLRYDEAATLGLVQRIQATYSPGLLRAKAGSGEASPGPIFIVGMPRSGTSLVEQVLASHPEVRGAGESAAFEQAAQRAVVGGNNPATAPEVAAALGESELRQIGGDYLRELRQLFPGTTWICDKMPGNFWLLGLIRLALPAARIIHIQRDPVDTCVSCFSQLFTGDHWPCTYELGELGRYYRAYAAVMEHWRKVLPATGIVEVQYEVLVSDFEAQARRLVQFCGLPWSDQCLKFYSTRRLVKTASYSAVRQPIYRSAVGRAHAVSPFLGPLVHELRGLQAPGAWLGAKGGAASAGPSRPRFALDEAIRTGSLLT